jgi:hypothetical protein
MDIGIAMELEVEQLNEAFAQLLPGPTPMAPLAAGLDQVTAQGLHHE